MKLGERIALLRKDPKTSRAGMKWTIEEYDQLLMEIKENHPIQEIAERHQRLPSSIVYHLYAVATFMIVNGEASIAEASELAGLDQDKLAKFCDNTITSEKKQYYITDMSRELAELEFSVIKIK